MDTTTKLHLCCGPRQRFPESLGWLNVDASDFGFNIVADLGGPWGFVEPESVDYIVCNDGFEHMADHQHFLSEASRVLKVGGRMELWVPHFKNPSAYRITHRSFYSWSLWDAYPEPHDATRNLKVVSNRIYVGHEHGPMAPINWLANVSPKWWERLAYVSNVKVILQKQALA